MTARVLIVDDLLANLKLIEARLSAEYFEVSTATNGADALALCASGKCDIVLLDVMMPGMDGLEVCRRLKGNKATAHITVVMVTALDQPSSLLHGFEAGADDFLAKPIDELALLALVKSLSRSRFALDELRSQALRSVNLGIGFPLSRAMASDGSGGRIMVAEDSPASAELIANALRRFHDVECIHDQDRVLDSAALGNYDLFIVSLDLTGYDGLRFCTRLRSMERTRQIPVLAIADPKDRQRILRGFDLGVNDYVPRPVDPGELAARARAQIRRKRHADDLRQTIEASLEMAAADPLTGLRNRRYLETHLGALLGQTRRDRLPLCVIILDLDDFKAVNDRHGHGAGDQVLQTFAARAKAIIRGTCTLCRLGGDEFVIIMPGTSLHTGFGIAEEIRAATASETFTLTPGGHEIPVTVSAGLAESANDSQSGLLRRADMALYRSKQGGRDRVCVDCAGAAVQARMAGCL